MSESKRIAALDLGSGTIKLSLFEQQGSAWVPLVLEERDTQLRRGMGPDGQLQAGPIHDTLQACAELLSLARGQGLEHVPAYGTSALRKASNREKLYGPLRERHGVNAKTLSEQEEGRLNLLGAMQPPSAALRAAAPPEAWPEQSRRRGSAAVQAVLDPGGDSSDAAWGQDWREAETASLPFGSVALQEAHHRGEPTGPIAFSELEAAKSAVKAALDAFAPAQGLKQLKGPLAIRMNEPIHRALAQFAGRRKGRYELDELRALTLGMAAMDHSARATLIAGEPVGKVDRTPFGFASWVATLEWMNCGAFSVEPFGIKLGAALYLNGVTA